VDDRTGAHRAGFERDEELAPGQPLVPERLGGGADGDDLSMGRGIVIGARRVAIGGASALQIAPP